MPCYSPRWDYRLLPGTPEYELSRSAVEASLSATYHVIDYYLKILKLTLPVPAAADAEIITAWAQSVGQTSRVPPEDLDSATIAHYGLAIYLIANHMSCDGVHFQDLWNQQSMINLSEPRELGYGWIMRWCVGVMTRRFEVAGWTIQLTHREKS